MSSETLAFVVTVLVGLVLFGVFSIGRRSAAKRRLARQQLLREREQRIAEVERRARQEAEARLAEQRRRAELERQFQQDMADAAYLDELARQEVERRAQSWKEGRPDH